MATNITQNTVPYIWTSANDDIIYTFTFKQKGVFGLSDDGNGFCEVGLIAPLDNTPLVGEYIFLDNPAYYGTYKIKSVTSTSQFVLDTPYIAPVVVYTTVRHLRIPIFSLYKGFKATEGYENDLPYAKVSDIKPAVLYDENGLPYISINIKGIVSKIFSISFNLVPNSIDYSTFNGIRLEWDSLSTIYNSTIAYTFCLNSAISNNELLCKIVEGFYLTPIDKPFIYSQGMTFTSYFDPITVVPKVKMFLNGVEL